MSQCEQYKLFTQKSNLLVDSYTAVHSCAIGGQQLPSIPKTCSGVKVHVKFLLADYTVLYRHMTVRAFAGLGRKKH